MRARAVDRLALQTAHRTAVIVQVQFALSARHLLAQVLSHTPTDLLAEHFHLSEAHVPNIEVSIVDPLPHELLRKSIDHRIQRAKSTIPDCRRKRKGYAS